MWGSLIRDEDTIPSHTAKIFENESESLVDVVNEVPDVVVFYDGVNDSYVAYQQGEGSGGNPQNEERRRIEFNLLKRPGDLAKTAVFSGIQQSATFRILKRLSGAQPSVPKREDVDHLAEGVVSAYEANFRIIEALSEAYGFEFLFVWQPNIFFKKTLSPAEEIIDASNEPTRLIYETIHTRIRESELLAGSDNFLNLEYAFNDHPETLYFDQCHLVGAGNEIIAKQLAPVLKKKLSQLTTKGGL